MASPTLDDAPAPPGALAEGLSFPRWQPRWNFSRHANIFHRADALVVSIPKSGRTWVRVFMAAYFSERDAARPRPTAPAHAYTHDLWEHETKGNFSERWRGKWLIPRADAARKPILLVARDPRDVMVSLYFHLRKRARTYGGDLPSLLRHPIFGVRRVVAIMNRWLDEWSRPRQLHLFRYEDARADPARAFAGALGFLLPGAEPDLAAVARAVEIASFDNMRRLEAGDLTAPGAGLVAELKGEVLRPCDAGDPESYKVRRGKVGGYVDYLAPSEIDFLNREIACLDPRYGYRSGSAGTSDREVTAPASAVL